MVSSDDGRLLTIAFDDEAAYQRFTEYVFTRFGGRGLELTDAPVERTVRVRPWLLDTARHTFDCQLLAASCPAAQDAAKPAQAVSAGGEPEEDHR